MRERICLGTCVLLCVAVSVPAAGADDDFAKMVRWQPGQSRAALTAVEKQVRAAAPAERKRLARRLVGLLRSDATFAAKQFILRQLRLVGSADEVPAIAALLGDKELSHMARYALQSIEAPAAAAALRDALSKLDGTARLGVIASLGARRDARAAGALIRLLDSPDESLATAAAAALGRIASAEASLGLANALDRATGKSRRALIDAVLQCADRFVAEGKAPAAAVIYERLFRSDEPLHVRVAALGGLAAASADRAAPTLVKLIHGADARLRAHAQRIFGALPAGAASRAIAAELPKATSAQAKIALLTALGERSATAAHDAVAAELKHPAAEVRLAAVRALGGVGGAGDVPTLVALMGGKDSAVAAAAEQSLKRLAAPAVDNAVLAAIDLAGPAMKQRLVACLAARKARGTVGRLFKMAGSGDEPLRLAVYRAVGVLGAAGQLGKLAGLLVDAPTAAQRDGLEKAMLAIATRTDNRARYAGAVLAPFAKAPTEAKCSLLRVAARLGGPEALAVHRDALGSKQPALRDAAIRAMLSWPDDAPAADLLAIAKAGSAAAERILALQGYIRMVGLRDDRPAAQAVAMYTRALAIAQRAAERRQALAGLAGVRDLRALEAVLPYLSRKDAVEEAAAAVVAIAGAIRGAHPEPAEAALEKVLEAAKSAQTRQAAAAVLEAMRRYRDFVTAWLVCGPFTGGNLFETAFPPEKDARQGKWKPLGGADWQIDLGRVLGGNNRAAYLKTRAFSPQAADARLEIGSDDGIKVWLNGKLVHAKNATRPVRAGEDKADARLQKGWNRLLVKLTQGGGDWAMCLKIVGRDGRPIKGLRVDPAGGGK